MSIERPKLSISEQIEHMAKKDITFNIISEEQAVLFLKESNYYFKLKSYEKIYEKRPASRDGKYINLDFAYLVELSKLDFYLRQEIILLSLNVEHFLKTKLIYDISENKNEDGYSIVKKFLAYNKKINGESVILAEIRDKGKNSTCHDLIEKYKESFAVWHFVELISFKYFIDFFEYYYDIYEMKNPYKNLLMPVKFLRNAAAHNNCLINHLNEKGGFDPTQKVLARIGNFKIGESKVVSNNSINNKMSNKIIHDFVVLLTVFNDAASGNNKKYAMMNLQKLFSERFVYRKEYFEKNITVQSSYKFVKKIIDFYCEKSI